MISHTLSISVPDSAMPLKSSHEIALKRICQYLKATHTQGLFFKPNIKEGFKCYIDAHWAGNWVKHHPNNKSNVLSLTMLES